MESCREFVCVFFIQNLVTNGRIDFCLIYGQFIIVKNCHILVSNPFQQVSTSQFAKSEKFIRMYIFIPLAIDEQKYI